jgi:hypothetical protein
VDVLTSAEHETTMATLLDLVERGGGKD